MGLLGCLQSSQQRFLRSASGGRLSDINNSLYTSEGSFFDFDKKVVLKVDLCQVHKCSELQESFRKSLNTSTAGYKRPARFEKQTGPVPSCAASRSGDASRKFWSHHFIFIFIIISSFHSGHFIRSVLRMICPGLCHKLKIVVSNVTIVSGS